MFGMCMLNLTIAMKLALVVFLLMQSIFTASVHPQEDTLPRIISPLPGEAVQGVVNIQAELDPAQTAGYELDFAYRDDPAENWFLVAEGRELPGIALQAAWDTTTISDGNYRLRLRVFLKNGLFTDRIVEGVRVRNYSSVETQTPTATPIVTGTPVPPTATPENTPTRGAATPLPPNPAGFDSGRFLQSVKNGLLVVAIIFALLGIHTIIRRLRREG